MRFTADGVDIPDELLWAQDEARVIFFCGAGVSRAKAELPDFEKLTELVLDALGATHEEDARKFHEFVKETKAGRNISVSSSDRVFQLLRRSFTDTDIGEQVAKCLKPKDGVDLGAHRTLLRLATQKTVGTRIVTTNFDRLFEQSRARLATATRSNLPNLAFNDANWGVVHLHGCVKSDYSGPTKDGFVLSSAEFGDAYLAMGWARDFVHSILDRYIAVFIGYSAEDPPIRYLLEGLQQSRGMRNRAYAFQAEADDQAAAAWQEKGVSPLLYSTENACGHRRLWETLDQWASRHENPQKWRSRRLKASQKGPGKLLPHERGMIAHIVSSFSGAAAFAQHKPTMSAEWLCVFDPHIRYGEPAREDGRYDSPKVDPHDRYRLDGDTPPLSAKERGTTQVRMPDRAWSAFMPNAIDFDNLQTENLSSLRGYFARAHPRMPRRLAALSSWITSVANQPAAAWWAGQQSALHPELLSGVKVKKPARRKRRCNPVDEAWLAIIEYHKLRADDDEIAFHLHQEVLNAGWHERIVSEYALHFAPKLKLKTLWRRPVPPLVGSQFNAADLVNVDVEYTEDVREIEVPDEYLNLVLPKIRAGLELAEDLEVRYSNHLDFCSIEPDKINEGDQEDQEFHREYKLSGHVLLFVRLMKRFAAIDPKNALVELNQWRPNKAIFRRLRVWALGILEIAPADMFAEELLSLPNDDFWPSRGERDLLLGLARRWAEFDNVSRKSIEARILRGPPRYARETKAEGAVRSAHRRLSRINWLYSRGCNFSFDLNVVNPRLRLSAPDWQPEYAANAADSLDGRSGWVRTDTDYSLVQDLPVANIIPQLEKAARDRGGTFVTYAPFEGLSRDHPEKALAALNSHNGSLPFPASYWATFLRLDFRPGDTSSFRASIAEAMISIADANFASISRAASDWFGAVGLLLHQESAGLFDSLWAKLMSALEVDVEARFSSLMRKDHQNTDWILESINSTPGRLAELAISLPISQAPKRGEGFPRPWLMRIEQLLALRGDARRYAVAIVGRQLNYFFDIDPNWTEQHILAPLDKGAEVVDREAILAGFFHAGQIPTKELFARLKSSLMEEAIRQPKDRDDSLGALAGILLACWGRIEEPIGMRLISSAEMHALLLKSSPLFRERVVGYLDRWSANGRWSSQISEFLTSAWPKQKSLRTARISARLCDLALSQEDRFPEVAEIVAKLVTKVHEDHLFVRELHNAKKSLASRFPEAMLGLLYAVLPANAQNWPYGAYEALQVIGETRPKLRADPRYLELQGQFI